jgi:hypothetical protein
MSRSRWRRWFDAVLPWYDPQREAASQRATARVLTEAKKVLSETQEADRVRAAYLEYGNRMRR